MTVTRLHLLRHGKVHNPDEILYGRLPGFRLAASGRRMADELAHHLSTEDIVLVASSPLERAQETAAPLAGMLDLPVVIDDRLIESTNDFEGARVPFSRATLSQRATWSRLRNPLRPSWGEPYLRIAQRMLAAMYAALAVAEGHQAVLVTHQLPIVSVRRFLTGQRLWHDPRRRQCSVASLTTFDFTDWVFTGFQYSEPAGHISAVNDEEVLGTPTVAGRFLDGTGGEAAMPPAASAPDATGDGSDGHGGVATRSGSAGERQ